MTTTAIDAERTERARELMVQRRRIDAELYATLVELDDCASAQAAGYLSLPSLVEDLWRVDARDARAWCAQSLSVAGSIALSGERLPARYPETAAALAEGEVGREHVTVIDRVMRRLEALPGLEPGGFAAAERILAAAARSLAPRGLDRVGRSLLARLDPDGVAPDETDAPDRVLRVRRRRAGGVSFDGAFDGALDAATLVSVLDALSTPTGPDDARTLDERRADALLELCHDALCPIGLAPSADSPADSPADDDRAASPQRPERRGQVQMTVTMPFEWLRDVTGHALLDHSTPIPPTDARRLCCDAGIVPVVLGGHGEPLDVGRLRYAVPTGMRRALEVRDQGCAWPGCGRPPRRCHAHHVRHWTDGGATRLDNLALLCTRHHSVVHRAGWRVLMRGGRPWFVPPPWIDPHQRARPGGPGPPDVAARP